jgi:hypothetical protein
MTVFRLEAFWSRRLDAPSARSSTNIQTLEIVKSLTDIGSVETVVPTSTLHLNLVETVFMINSG